MPATIAILGVVLSALMTAAQSFAQAAPGDLDPAFGNAGRVLTPFGEAAVANAAAIQPDGRIVAAGFQGVGGNNDFALARYSLDGSPDTSFGAGGKVVTDLGGKDDEVHRVAVQTDGRIVVVGRTNLGGDYKFALARYNQDGSLDGSFGSGGIVVTDFGPRFDIAMAVAIQADGKIVAAGGRSSGNSGDFALARYLADGSLDPTFGVDGKVTTDFGGDESANAVVIQADGKIVAGGASSVFNPNDFALARYLPDGKLDTSFGARGTLLTDFGGNDGIVDLAIQSDGHIVAAGAAGPISNGDFAVARYTPDGALDPSFGAGGKVVTTFHTSDTGAGIALQPDGKLVMAGSANPGQQSEIALARYGSDGRLDATFGAGGKAITGYERMHVALGMALQVDGKIVAAGYSGLPPNQFLSIMRFHGDDALADALPECAEPNDAPNAACLLADNTRIEGSMHAPGDVDAFRLDIRDEGARVRLVLTDLAVDADLYLADADGLLLGQSVQDGTAPEVVELNLPGGTYFVYARSDPGRALEPGARYSLLVRLLEQR